MTELESQFDQIWKERFEEYVELFSGYGAELLQGLPRAKITGELSDLDLADGLVRDFQTFLTQAQKQGISAESDFLGFYRGFFEGRFEGYIEFRAAGSIMTYNSSPSRENLVALESVILRLCSMATTYHWILRHGHPDQAKNATVLSELWAFRAVIIMLMANNKTNIPIGMPRVSAEHYNAWLNFRNRTVGLPEGTPLHEEGSKLSEELEALYLRAVIRSHDALLSSA